MLKLTPPHLVLLTSLIVATLLYAATAIAEAKLPLRSGRVVDQAGLLRQDNVFQLTQLMQQHERTNHNQLVVITIPSLQGLTIEEYAHQLASKWKIGQKEKHHSVLLIVAPNERKVHIKVSDGLEGTLTEALSANIIHSKILPKFTTGKFNRGISDGVKSIINAINNEYVAEKLKVSNNRQVALLAGAFLMFAMLQLFGSSVLGTPAGSGKYRRGRYGGYYGKGGFRSSRGFSDDGLSGGGSFGGGGAAGGW